MRLRRVRPAAIVAALVLLCVATLSTALPTSASVYGRGSYGKCIYEDCTPVVVVTPSGLEVAINLHDDQEIPSNGYTVTVTPLNGAGSSFKEARIYLEGVLVKTITPDDDGTARWDWTPSTQPGTHIKIDIVDTSNAITSHTFTVTIGPPVTTTPGTTGGNTNSGQTNTGSTPNSAEGVSTGPLEALTSFIGGIGSGVQQSYRQLQQIVRDLPAPVAETFPYFLFLLLGINLLILYMHFQRELRELRAYQAILTRARQLAEQKQVFISLISHYLRTPVTVLAGGIDLLTANNAERKVVDMLRPIVDGIRSKIDTLLERTKVLDTRASLDRKLSAAPAFWRQFNLFLPLVCIGLILVLYNVLALTAGKFSHSEIQVIAQLIVFGTIVFATYQIFRRRHLSSQDRTLTQELVRQEEELAEARDSFMTSAVASLSADVHNLEGAKAALQNIQSTDRDYIMQGIQRLQTVIEEFTTAEGLRGIHATQPETTVSLSALLHEVEPALEPQLGRRNVNVVLHQDAHIKTSNPSLLVRALRHVLTNAVEYSPPSSQVDITSNKAEITIHDNGAGVPPEKLPLIFQPFYKAEGAQSFNHEGMGFSLYLDKIIMTYLGGDIRLDSAPGRGTTVTLSLAPTK